METPLLLLLSGPSGSGKTTLAHALVKSHGFAKITTATTRAPRPGEIDGEHYIFCSHRDFEDGVSSGYFLEHAKVYGNFYGTPLQPVATALSEGKRVCLVVDPQGAQQIRRCGVSLITENLLDVFIHPPSIQAQQARLLGRGTESLRTIQDRMADEKDYAQHAKCFQKEMISSAPTTDLSALVKAVDEFKPTPSLSDCLSRQNLIMDRVRQVGRTMVIS